MSEYYALIPARGGSKGIPEKNLALISGIPLINYTIQAARDSKIFKDIIVSSDDSKILKHCESLGVIPLKRPEEIAQDDSTADQVISHFINSTNLKSADMIVYLQPTSPLRTSTHIVEASHIYEPQKSEMVMSVLKPDHHPLKSFKIQNDGTLSGFFAPDAPFQTRQSLPELFAPNGAIYIFSVGSFLKNNKIPRERIYPYLMSKEDSIDIDYPSDLLIASVALKRNQNEA